MARFVNFFDKYLPIDVIVKDFRRSSFDGSFDWILELDLTLNDLCFFIGGELSSNGQMLFWLLFIFNLMIQEIIFSL